MWLRAAPKNHDLRVDLTNLSSKSIFPKWRLRSDAEQTHTVRVRMGPALQPPLRTTPVGKSRAGRNVTTAADGVRSPAVDVGFPRYPPR